MLKHVDRVTHSQLQEYLRLHYEAKAPICVWGHSAIGKSEAIEEFAESIGMPHRTFLLGTTSPEELWGPQVYEPGQTRQIQLLPWWWPEEPTIIFLDELGGALEETRGSAFNFILRREYAGHKLPEGSWVVGATNTNADGSHHNEMGVPTLTRFGHVELVTDIDEWLDKAKQRGVRSDIRQFMRAYPQELFRFDEGEYAVEPRPRKWMEVDKVMKARERMIGDEIDIDNYVVRCAISGQVGIPSAEQYIKFMREARGGELSIKTWEAAKDGHKAVRRVIDAAADQLTMAAVAQVMAGLPTKSFGNPKKIAEGATRTMRIVRAFAEWEMESEGQIPCIELSMGSLDEVMDRWRSEDPDAEEKFFDSDEMRPFGVLMDAKSMAPAERSKVLERLKSKDRSDG